MIVFHRFDSSVYAEDDSRVSGNESATTIYTTAYEKYSYAVVQIRRDSLTPTAEFIQEVKAALKTTHKPRRDALKDVFDNYGDVVRTEFTLGASIAYMSSTKRSSTVRLYTYHGADSSSLLRLDLL